MATNGTDTNSAFTLIELLVVIAIIGILSSVVLASLSGARESARDARRASDFDQFRTAMEMYYNDYESYPNDENEQVSEDCSGTGLYANLVGNGYLSSMPTDPSENINVCDGLIRGSGEDEFYYSYDNTQTGHSREACFGIQNFEDSNNAGSLENINQQGEVNFVDGGGLGSADFVYCFDK